MTIVKTSGRALLLALLPAAFLQGALLALSQWAWQFHTDSLTPDGLLGLYILHVALTAALLMAGHLTLRHFGYYGRMAYAGTGAVAAAIAYAMATRYGLSVASGAPGTLVTAAVMPMLAGALSGFLYSQFAGLDTVDAGGVDAGPFRGRFEGPVRVRTSLGAMALTAALPAALIAVLAFSVTQVGLGGSRTPALMLIALPAQIFLTSLLASVVPAAIFILVTHHIARALGYSRGLEYAGIGAATGLAFAGVVFPFSPFVSVVFLLIPATAFGALMGALYRRFAGLEPVPMPEAVIVTDVEALVPADDPSRRGHSVLLNG